MSDKPIMTEYIPFSESCKFLGYDKDAMIAHLLNGKLQAFIKNPAEFRMYKLNIICDKNHQDNLDANALEMLFSPKQSSELKLTGYCCLNKIKAYSKDQIISEEMKVMLDNVNRQPTI